MKILINTKMAFLNANLSIQLKNLLAIFVLLAFFQINLQAQPGKEVCPEEPCPCNQFLQDLSVYYFGEDNVTIEVYRNASENQLITTFANVNSGDLLFVDGSNTINNRLGTYTYFRVINAADEYCTTRIFSRCPSNTWPGALDDQQIMGKTFGDFVVYAYTDTDLSECTIANIDQDWHVGGNVVGPTNKTMGTRNDEDVIFISHDIDRGTITRTGQWGINTLAPAAQLDVQGDAIVNETLDVNGIARMNAGTSSNSPANGALIVSGGAGISENVNIGNDANVGNDLDVANNGHIGNDLTVDRDAAIGRDLDVVNDGTIGNDLAVGHDLDVTNNGAIGNDLGVGHNLDVINDGAIGNNLTVGQDALVGNDLDVVNDAQIGRDLDVDRDAQIDNNLDVDNDATIDHDLNVGADAAVGGNLSVNQNATVAFDVSVGDDLDVAGDAHVDGVLTIGTNNTPNMLGTVSTSAYQLFVDGGILTEEVLVRTGWADYVFEAGYELMSLEQVAQYVAQHGHLPNIPSAQEVATNGLGLGNTAVLQQEKIEELFLHLIEMNEAIKTLQAENRALRAEVEKLR
jgi:acyl-[acyl carrier protein]--UDP-N-acetylglucosamine O-acyltransferase